MLQVLFSQRETRRQIFPNFIMERIQAWALYPPTGRYPWGIWVVSHRGSGEPKGTHHAGICHGGHFFFRGARTELLTSRHGPLWGRGTMVVTSTLLLKQFQQRFWTLPLWPLYWALNLGLESALQVPALSYIPGLLYTVNFETGFH